MRRRPSKGFAGKALRSNTGSVLLAVAGLGVAMAAFAAVSVSTPPAASDPHAAPIGGYTRPILTHSKPAAPIDINSASLAQLKSLPGIDDVRAKLIIARRPYHSKAQLVSANVIPAGVYQSIRHQIIAIQPGPSRPSRHP
jgi:DNA uptake protein ComE-like DNA-binding protein